MVVEWRGIGGLITGVLVWGGYYFVVEMIEGRRCRFLNFLGNVHDLDLLLREVLSTYQTNISAEISKPPAGCLSGTEPFSVC